MLNEQEFAETLNTQAFEVTAICPELDLKRDNFGFDFVDSSGIHRVVKFSGIKRFNLNISRTHTEEGYGFIINDIECIIGNEVKSCEFELHAAKLYIEFEKIIVI